MTLSFLARIPLFPSSPLSGKAGKGRQLETRFGTLKKAVTNLRVTEEDSEGEKRRKERLLWPFAPSTFLFSRERERAQTWNNPSSTSSVTHKTAFQKEESPLLPRLNIAENLWLNSFPLPQQSWMTFQHNLCKARDKPFTASSTTKADGGCKDVRDYFARGFGALNIIIQMLTVSARSQAGGFLQHERERAVEKAI